MSPGSGSDGLLLALVGSVVPDDPQYRTAAFSVAGNASQARLIRSLRANGVVVDEVISFVPVPSFPRSSRLWQHQATGTVEGVTTVLLPFLNVMPAKFACLGWGIFRRVAWWSWENRRRPRVVHMYNVGRPPGLFAYAAARLTGAAVTASLYDVGTVGRDEPDTVWQRLSHRLTKWLVRRLDGRIVITPAIERDFAAGRPCLLVDGGVSEEWLDRFEPAAPDSSSAATCVFLLAGSLWEINGVGLVLEAFGRLGEPGFVLLVAGQGPLQAVVKAAAARDARILPLGFLGPEDLASAYARADVLLNIRLTESNPAPYHFPSKLHEYLATGRLVISTPAAHIRDEYGDFCLILEREDADALAELMQRAARMPAGERRAVGQRAREYMRAEKTWTAQGRRIAAYLAAAAAKANGEAADVR
ncbi:MAG TPA: glycosyltransferase [Vicinamibacterales bacterium]|nr:glycosyltransferase [Vicinamibacterales bacterium]HPW21052.1 glycosyltransferase [Vicinamibacterales bacterium]